MAKTELILTHNIVGLGAESDQVKVAAGYARNYLIPQGLAIPVTAANKRRLEALKQRRAEREAHEFNTMSELAKSLSKLTVLIHMKAGEDGKMFGSVTPGIIADELKHQFEVAVEKRKINLPAPIRMLGDYDVELRLHPEVITTLKVRVESTTPHPKLEEVVAEPPKDDRRERERGRPDAKRGEPRKAERSDKPDRAEKADKADRPEKADARKTEGAGAKRSAPAGKRSSAKE